MDTGIDPGQAGEDRRAFRAAGEVNLSEHVFIPDQGPDASNARFSFGLSGSVPGAAIALGAVPLFTFAMMMLLEPWEEMAAALIFFPLAGAIVTAVLTRLQGGSDASALLTALLAAIAAAAAVGAALIVGAFMAIFGAF